MDKLLERSCWLVLGLPLDEVNLQQAVSQVNDAIVNRQRCFLSTPNINFAITCQDDADFYQSVVESDLSIPDGMPLIWIAKLLDIPIKERVAGSTIFDALSAKARERKINVFFFGGQAGVAQQAHERLNSSGLDIMSCGFYDPGFVSVDQMSLPHIIEKINQAEPDFIVVALGAKKGQEWIQLNKRLLQAPVISHLGAVVNFVAGTVDRAPVFWQKLGLEWLWRIKQEPSLWRRYFFDGLKLLKILVWNVLPLAFHNRLAKRLSYYTVLPKIEVNIETVIVLKLSGSFKHDTLSDLKARLCVVSTDFNNDVVINCVNLEYIDSACIATLLLLQAELNKSKRELRLCNVSQRIKLVLKLNQVFDRFFYL